MAMFSSRITQVWRRVILCCGELGLVYAPRSLPDEVVRPIAVHDLWHMQAAAKRLHTCCRSYSSCEMRRKRLDIPSRNQIARASSW